MRLFIIISGIILLNISSVFAQPQPCGDNPQMTSFCADACVICDMDGFTGVNDLTATGQGFSGFCTSQYNNMQYMAFVAGSEDLTIVVDVGVCTGGINSLEVGFFESFDCQNFTPISPCDTDIPSNSSQEFVTDVTLTVGQYYYLVIDGSNGANCSWTFNVIEGSTLALPLPESGDISGPSDICPQIPATFSTTEQLGAALYDWSVNGDVQVSSGSNSAELSFPGDGVFEVCVTASNVCNEAPPSCILVNAYTPGISTIDTTICDGECITANGVQYCETGDFQEFITFPTGCDSTVIIALEVLETPMESITVMICNDTFYQVGNSTFNQEGIFMETILTSNECDSIVTLDLSVIECEIIIIPESVPVICNGTATGTLIFSVDQGEPPLTWTYTNLLDPSITGTGMTNLLVDNEIPNVPFGSYNIYVTDNFGNDAVVFQDVDEPPVLTSDLTPSNYNGFNVSCAENLGLPGNDGSITAHPDGGVPPYSYLWSDGQTDQTATDLLAVNYIVTITDDVGCTQTNSLTLDSPPIIITEIDFIDPNCSGLETGEISILSTSGGVAPYQYSIDSMNFQIDGYFDNLPEGIYIVQIQDGNGCIISEQSEIFAPEIPVILSLDDITLALGCEIEIVPEINISTFSFINWFDSSTLDCDDCLTPVANPVNDTRYTLTVSSVDSCTTEGTLNVTVEKNRAVFIPNTFSPNGDGYNDFFTIFAGKEVSSISSLIIFDRWGEFVYEAENFPPNDLSKAWDGKFKGRTAASGMYAYRADVLFLDGVIVSYSGDVVIMR